MAYDDDLRCAVADMFQGLASNVGLTISKGLAGLWMNSASLLAEAGHSLSDLLGVSRSSACVHRPSVNAHETCRTSSPWRRGVYLGNSPPILSLGGIVNSKRLAH
jgi:hypothetical protein